MNPFSGPFSPYNAFAPDGMNLAAAGVTGMGMQGMNRTVYLGNIHPKTTTEDLCNAIRGGVLQSHDVYAGQAYRGACSFVSLSSCVRFTVMPFSSSRLWTRPLRSRSSRSPHIKGLR